MSGLFNTLWNNLVNCGCFCTPDQFCEWLEIYDEDSAEFRSPDVTSVTPIGEATASIEQMKKLREEVRSAPSTTTASSSGTGDALKKVESWRTTNAAKLKEALKLEQVSPEVRAQLRLLKPQNQKYERLLRDRAFVEAFVEAEKCQQ